MLPEHATQLLQVSCTLCPSPYITLGYTMAQRTRQDAETLGRWLVAFTVLYV